MFQFLSRLRANPNLSLNSIPETMNDPINLAMHQRALRGTMYGLGDIIRAEVDSGKVKFRYMRSGKLFDSAQEAFQEAGKDGVTTFTRITGDLTTSSLNMRGLAGLEQRLINMQTMLKNNPALARELGVNDPSKLYFTTGTFKTAQGAKGTMENLVARLGEGLYVSDKDEFNLLQVFEGDVNGQNKAFDLQKMSRLFEATSGEKGGLFGKEAIIASLEKGDLGSLFSKAGKRFRGAIGIRDVSLTGEYLRGVLQRAPGIQGTTIQGSTKVFNVSEDVTNLAKEYLRLGITGNEEAGISKALIEQLFSGLDEEAKAFYEGDHTVNLIRQSLERSGITGLADFADGGRTKVFGQSVEFAYDGTAILNANFVRSMTKTFEEELETLKAATRTPEIDARIMDLESQLYNLRNGDFQALTTRTFFEYEGMPKMLKAVLDSRKLKDPLSKYMLVTTNVALKKETALMSGAETFNLVLQGEAGNKVYYDPLAPAFHYNIFSSQDFIQSQRLRRERIIGSFQNLIDTGNIDPKLRATINKMAEDELSALPEAVRSTRYRNRLFARELKNAMDSGVDIRTMPELMNFLHKNAVSDLYRVKDNEYQIAMEGIFRVALDTESSYYSGTENVSQAFLGKGIRQLGGFQAAEFQMQGHKLLFGANAFDFKHALGGFDLDDHGIVMPKIFKSADGKETLSTFIVRQPTGPAEFMFATPKFGNVDTVNAFMSSSDSLSVALEEIMKEKDDDVFNMILKASTSSGREKRLLDRAFLQYADTDNVNDALVQIMTKAEQMGIYKKQYIEQADPILEMMRRARRACLTIAINKRRSRRSYSKI